ncbi:hypothetical protein CHARACLAT_031439, partial [Characodon lateralis]|nr:hypothetical protein [Characodon lateralis]
CQQNVIRELEPLRSHLRLMAKECDWKILAQWGEEQTRTEILKREKQQLLKDIKALRDRGEAVQTMVDHLQSELSNLYLQFRKERDARRLLIWQLNELKGGSVKTEIPAEGNREDNKDSVELKLALKVCQEDLTKMQEELTRVKAEYWDSLEQAHNLTQLQVF